MRHKGDSSALQWRQTYCNDVDKVIFSQSVQNGDDGVLGNGHPQALHAATDIHNDDNVLGRGGRLDVPARKRTQGSRVGSRGGGMLDMPLSHRANHSTTGTVTTATQQHQAGPSTSLPTD